MIRKIYCLALGCLLILAGGACGEDPVEAHTVDVSTLFARLELNHKAIILSLNESFDSVQLSAVPRNLRGELLPYTEPVQFRRLNELDTTVSVNADGFVTARVATNGTRVEASLTIDGITRTDTTLIMVRSESPVRKLSHIEFFPLPPDSSWRWGGYPNAIGYERWVRFFDTGMTLVPASQAVVAYSWENNDVVSISSQKPYPTAFGVLGETYIHARVYAYGKVLSDSVLFRRIEPTAKFVVIDRIVPSNGTPSIVFYPAKLEVNPGTTVIFFNMRGMFNGSLGACSSASYFCGNRILHTISFTGSRIGWVDSVDVEFDNPVNVESGDTYGRIAYKGAGLLGLAYPSDRGVGNIAPFSFVRCEVIPGGTSNTNCGGRGIGLLDPGFRSRKFTIPGTYNYTSVRFPGVTGSITVKQGN